MASCTCPCNSGIMPMLLATLCLVLASQGMGVLMIGTLPTLRLGLSFASLSGGAFILYVRTIIPCYGHASGSARISQSVPAASLFPDLCRSGPERLSDDLFMDKPMWRYLFL